MMSQQQQQQQQPSLDFENEHDGLDGNSKRQLLQQISELQEAVNDMKQAFTSAVQQLGTIHYDDQILRDKVEQNKTECQDQIAEVIKLMLSLKAEFAAVKCQVQQVQDTQLSFQHQIHGIVLERDILIEELYKTGSVSEQLRQRLLHSHRIVGRASSGTQSNDSGIALLLEKAQVTFHPCSLPTPSDQESVSVSESSPVLVSSMVRDYVAGLGQHPNGQCDPEPHNNNYDSDSSLVIAANKSLSLSTSLGKQCGLELDHSDSSEEEGENGQQLVLDCAYDAFFGRKSRDALKQQLKKVEGADYRGSSATGKSSLAALDSRTSRGQIGHQFNNPKMRSTVQDQHFRESQRLRVTRDILETERKYCKMLWTLRDTFAEPLKRNGILSSNDVNTIFPEEVYKLYEKHCMLLHKLEERCQAWKWHGMIGDILIKFIDPEESDVLLLYTSYVNDFPEVLKTFHKLCRHSSNFTKFLKASLEHPNCGGLDLGYFLLTPVQRIPHYILFLKQMVKFTDLNHPDFNYINLCLHRLKDFLNRLNDSMEHSFQLITAQISPQADIDPASSKCNSSSKQLKSMLRDSQEESFELENLDIPSDDDEEPLPDDYIEPTLRTSRCGSKESLGSVEQDRGLYKKCNKSHKGKTSWGSQESLKLVSASSGKGLNCSIGRGSPANCSSGSLTGSCRAKLRSRSRSESVVSTSTTNSDSVHLSRGGYEGLMAASCKRGTNESGLSHRSARGDIDVQDIRQLPTETSGAYLNVLHEIDDASDTETMLKITLTGMQHAHGFSASKSMQDVQQPSSMDSEPDLSDSADGNEGLTTRGAMMIRHLEHGNSLTSISESPEASKKPDPFASYKSTPTRPLKKAHSAHAVHQISLDQSPRDDDWNSASGAGGSGKKSKGKGGKQDKKRVSLRTLKSILFFRKRNAALKAVDIGTCTSHDDLFVCDAKMSHH